VWRPDRGRSCPASTITPPANDFSDFTLTVTATASEAVGSSTASSSTTIDVTVVGSADAPT
jgi:hypothetical protein